MTGFQPVAMNWQDAFIWKTGFQPVMAECVILLDGQDAGGPSQARCLTSIQKREESRASKDFAPRVACDLVPFDID